jgi:hypothetical protein
MPPPTFLGLTRGWRVTLVVGLAAIGAALGWFLPWLTGWALGLPWVPFRGLLRLIDSTPDPWLQYGATGVGLLIGGGLGLMAVYESLAITITDQQVELRTKGATRTIEKKQQDDVGELRRAVARLGIFVRDDSNRQYWRRLDQR